MSDALENHLVLLNALITSFPNCKVSHFCKEEHRGSNFSYVTFSGRARVQEQCTASMRSTQWNGKPTLLMGTLKACSLQQLEKERRLLPKEGYPCGKVDVSSQLSFCLAERGNKIPTNESRQALCWKMTQAHTILPAL